MPTRSSTSGAEPAQASRNHARFPPTQYSGLVLLLLGPVLFAGGLYLEWREIMSRTRRVNGPGGTYSLLVPSIHTLPSWPLWLAGLGMLLALSGLVLLAVRSRSRDG